MTWYLGLGLDLELLEGAWNPCKLMQKQRLWLLHNASHQEQLWQDQMSLAESCCSFASTLLKLYFNLVTLTASSQHSFPSIHNCRLASFQLVCNQNCDILTLCTYLGFALAFLMVPKSILSSAFGLLAIMSITTDSQVVATKGTIKFARLWCTFSKLPFPFKHQSKFSCDVF